MRSIPHIAFENVALAIVILLAWFLVSSEAFGKESMKAHRIHFTGKDQNVVAGLDNLRDSKTRAMICAQQGKLMSVSGQVERLGEVAVTEYHAPGYAARYTESYRITSPATDLCSIQIGLVKEVRLVHRTPHEATIYQFTDHGRKAGWTKSTQPKPSESAAAALADIPLRAVRYESADRILNLPCQIFHLNAGTGEGCQLAAGKEVPQELHGVVLRIKQEVMIDGKPGSNTLQADRVELNVQVDRSIFNPPASATVKNHPAQARERP